MGGSAAEAFHAWHDFYMLIASAAATLIGAMFVVASIGSGFLTPRHAPQIRAFLTPTVIHLSSVLVAAALAMVPTLDWRFLGAAYGLGGSVGMGYSLVIGVQVARRRVEWSDQVWYAVIPVVGYVVILAAALTIFLRSVPSLEALATGFLLLFVAGIRNSWDLIVFFASRNNPPT